MLELTTEGWILAFIGAIAVGLAKGGLAMVGMLSVPLLSLVMSPVQAAGLMLPVYVISDIGGLVAYRREYDWTVLKTALPGTIAGIMVGWATAHIVPVRGVTMIVGLIGVAFAANAILRRKVETPARRPSYVRGSFWGVLSGYTSFVSHSGAPPWQVYAQPLRMPAVIFAGTTTWFFAVTNWVKLIPYAALGQLSLSTIKTALVLTPAAMVSVWVGLQLVRIMPQRVFYILITWGLLLVSLRLVWQGAFP